MPYLLGLDIGTTTIKAWLYDAASGEPIASAARPTPVRQVRQGWAEHDPEALWLATAASLRDVTAVVNVQEIAGIAVASMGEAGVPLDQTGRPLFPIIAYYDTRGDSYVDWWRTRTAPEAIHAISGQVLRSPFAVMKLLWLRNHQPELFAQIRRWLSVGDYIIRRLSDALVTDWTLASRTMLFDQRERKWSRELLHVAELDESLFPESYPSGTLVGAVTQAAAEQTGLPFGTPVATGGHDHLCGALAVGVTESGQALVSFGTAGALLAPSEAFHGGGAVFAQGLSCYSHTVEQRYVIQGGLGAAGGALAWLARTLRGAADDATFAALELEAAQSPAGARGLVWLPHLKGSGTPERDSASRAALIGLRDEHTHGDIWRAHLESLAYWARRNIDAIEAARGSAIERLTFIGGAARSALLSQILASVTQRPVALPEIAEATTFGAALLAGKAVGVSTDTMRSGITARIVEPNGGWTQQYDRLYNEAYVPLYDALRAINHVLQENEEPRTKN
jgi:xylulokinase